jgi:hypothetical protein
MDFVYTWAIRRRGANPRVAQDFARWYGMGDASHESLAEAWHMFEMYQWELD